MGLFLGGVDPSLRTGVRITKTVISSERSGRLFRTSGNVFWGVLKMGSRPSRAAALRSRISGKMDALGQKSKIATQCGKRSFYHCIPSSYYLIPPGSRLFYVNRLSSASSTSTSRFWADHCLHLAPLFATPIPALDWLTNRSSIPV